ncbi:MAG TPA: glycosyltransferase family 9 protein [Rhodospirillaceae bacterium]|nr:glycosyltransferase family 9 protein [Rhodospirillaceae bacterium]
MNPSRQPQILFITATRLGDAVLSTGLLQAVINQNPGAQMTVACGPVPAPLFRAVPNLENMIVMKKLPNHGHWIQLWQQCIGTRWDLIIDLRRSFAAQLLFSKRKELPRERMGEHKVEHYARTLNLPEPPAPTLWFDNAARMDSENALPSGKKYFAVGPTANWAGKIWPVERFIEVISELTKPGAILADYTPVIFGAPGEENQIKAIHEEFGDQCIYLVGKLDPLATAAAIARCDFFIGNDSGLMHVAAAAGVPTLGLFGPSHPEIYGPWGEHTHFVRTDRSFAELTGGPDYDHRTTGTLMDSLPTSRVLQSAQSLWHKIQSMKQAA